MFAARGVAQRNIAHARLAKEASEWNAVHETDENEANAAGTANAAEVVTGTADAEPISADGNEGTPKQEPQGPTEAALDSGNGANPATDGDPNAGSEAEDTLIRHIPLTGLSGLRLLYVWLANVAITTLNTTWFNSLVMLCISWASLSVGLQTYPSLADDVTLNDLDFFVLAVFILEAFIKILAEGLAPWQFFTGKEMRWNCFDFAIIVMSLPVWGTALGGSSIAILRMLRLMRIMKLVKRIPQLYMIVMGLIGGLKSIGYIMLLLFLVFYLYAISGMYAWQDNDTFHFRSVPIAMVTLFRMCTLENWSAIMNINYFGCDRYDGGYYSEDPAAAASFEYCNVTAVYGAFTNESQLASQRAVNQVMASFYFVTFILISAFVMLSLFIGTITMSMAQSMEHMKRVQEEVETKRRAEKVRKRALEAEHRTREAERKRAATAAGLGTERHGEADHESQKKEKGLSLAERRERQKMREVLMQTWDDCDLTDILTQSQGDKNSLKGRYLMLSAFATRIVEHHNFSLFVTCVIVLAGLMVGLQTSPEVTGVLGGLLSGLDTAILAVFTTEVVLKLLSEGLEPWQYFRSAWNTFDCIIVVGSFTRGTGGMLTMLRLLRLLRVLKLVRAFPQLQVIVSALLKGLSSIGYIGLILLLCFYVFGIVGNMLFADNDPFHFQYLHFAMLSLFQMATMDGWSDVLYINYYGCDLYGYDSYRALGYTCKSHGSGFVAVLYFVTFIVLGAMVLITLFIGVVTTSMEEATQEMEAEKELLRRVEALRAQRGVDIKVVNSYMQVFRMLDLDGSGSVEEAELRTGLAAIGKNPSYEELKEMMDTVDEDGSGQIDIVEFVEFMIHVREKSDEQRAAKEAAAAVAALPSSDAFSGAGEDSTAIPATSEAQEVSGFATERGSIGPSSSRSADPQEGERLLPPLEDASTLDDIRVVSIEPNIKAEAAPHASAATWGGRHSWSSPRTSSPRTNGNCNVMPYLEDKDLRECNANGDGDVSERPSPSEADATEQPRPRSGRVTAKILPSG